MSKLDEILLDATAAAYSAGIKWSKTNPTTHLVDEACDTAKAEIKDLIKELVENRIDMNDFAEKVKAL